MQRIVDALRGERGERPRFAGYGLERAVGDQIVGSVEIWHVEQVADWPLDALRDRAVDMGALEEGEMHRDRRLRFRHHHRHAMVSHDQAQLFDKIVLEQVRPGDGGRVMAGRRHMAVGLP
jgi:hypothetical protein